MCLHKTMIVKIATELYSECVMFGHVVITDIHGSITDIHDLCKCIHSSQ